MRSSKFLTVVGAIFSLFLLPSLAQSCRGVQPGSNQKLIRFPYLNGVTESTATILWGTSTDVPNQNASVTLTSIDGGNQITASAQSQILSSFWSYDTQLFIGQVKGLQPGTRYCYSVHNNGVELAGGLDFRTAPKVGSNETVRFVAIGDFGAGTRGQKRIRDALNSKLEQSDLFLALGDNVYLTGTQYQYNKFNFEVYQDQWPYIPLYLTIGNHDWYHDRAATYLKNFYQPRNPEAKENDQGRFFSWDWGQIHFINLDTEQSLDADPSDPSSMVAWLERDLQKTTQKWKIAILHKPPYTQSRVADERVVEKLVPLFEKYRVQAVLGGHWHNYQRFPLMSGDRETPMNEGGVLYITSGGGGYPIFGELIETKDGGWIYEPERESPYIADMRGNAPVPASVFIRQFHFIYVEVSDCVFSIQAINDDLEVIDTFSTSRC